MSPASAAPSTVITFDDGDRTGGGVLGVYQPGVVVTPEGALLNPATEFEGRTFAWFGPIRHLAKAGDNITVTIPVVRTFDIKPLKDTTAQPLAPHDAASGAPTSPPIKLQGGQWQTITLPAFKPGLGDTGLVRVGSGFYLDNVAYETVSYTVKGEAAAPITAQLAHLPKKAIAAGGLLVLIVALVIVWIWRRMRAR